MASTSDSQTFRIFALLLAFALLAGVICFSWLTGSRWPRQKAKDYLAMLSSQIPGLAEFPCEASATDYIRSLRRGFQLFSTLPVCARGMRNGYDIEIDVVPRAPKRPLRTVVAVLYARPVVPAIYVQPNSAVVRFLNSVFIPGVDTSRPLIGPYAVFGDPKEVERVLRPEKLAVLLSFPRTLDFVRYEERAIVLQWSRPEKDARVVEQALALATLLLPPEV
jgi:hypothetical protein